LRNRILAAAEQLLDEAGPGGLSMREVARRIGVERIHLSLTHTGTMALAFVILEGGGGAVS